MEVNPDRKEQGGSEWKPDTGMVWAVLIAVTILSAMVAFTVFIANLGKAGW